MVTAQKTNSNSLLGISSRKQFWFQNLKDHKDTTLVKKFLECIESGFPVGIEREIPIIHCRNWPSCEKFHSKIDEFLADRLEEGSVQQVSPTNADSLCISPLGAFEKGKEKKLRVIHDLSYPPDLSVNSYLDKSDYSVKYSTVRDAVDICMTMSTPWMAKTDLKNAYYSCPIQEKDRNKLGFCFPRDGSTQYFRWAALPYGLRPAAFWFDLTANMLRYIYVKHGAANTTLYYLDDVITITNDRDSCQDSLDKITEVCEKAGFTISSKKTVGPSRIITFLGIEIDTIKKQLKMSDEKMAEIKSDLNDWKGKTYCSKRDLLSILGKMNFCSQMILHGKKFMRRLIELSTKGKTINSKLSLTRQAKADIEWWIQSMAKYNGIEWFPKEINVEYAILVFSDASNIALAGICGQNWTIIPYVGEYFWLARKTIQYRELYAAVMTIATFAYQLRNKQVIMHIDNQSMQRCIVNGTSKVPEIMGLIRALYHYTTIHNIDYKCIHIGTTVNVESDCLSRLRLTEFYMHMPNACKRMSRPARIIRDF